MNNYLAQVTPNDLNFWAQDNGTAALWVRIVLALLVGIGLLVALLKVPTHARRYIVAVVTFLSGLFFVLSFVVPQPINLKPTEQPLNAVESFGKFLNESTGIVVNFTQVLSSFLLGLGIFSLLKIHFARIFKGHKDSFFSIVLLISMALMAVVSLAARRNEDVRGAALDRFENWTLINKLQDLLFEGLLQQMDAIMFSLIAFFILSAAYRAFRVRSIEATILLAVALLMILSLMGLVKTGWDGAVGTTLNGNLTLTEITGFLKKRFQTPAINAIGFGTGLGALAMGVRIWLSLEKRGGK